MRRTRLGRLLVALGLVLLVAGGLAVTLVAVVSAPSVATEATPDLLDVEEVSVPVRVELARAVVAALPPGAISDETAWEVAARLVRDDVVVDQLAIAAADTHRQWDQGVEPVLVLDSQAVTPATVAALRDVDLALARTLGDDVTVSVAPIALPFATATAERIEAVADAAYVALVVALILFLVGAAVDERRDRTLRAVSTSLLVYGAVVGVSVVACMFAPAMRWQLAVVAAMVAAAKVPLLVVAAASVGLGGFLRAVAAQIAPGVEARIEARRRAAIAPPPATTGPQSPRQLSARRSRATREEALDAFFAPEDPGERDADADAEVPVLPGTGPAARARTEFDQVIDSVEATPEPTVGDGADTPPDADSDGRADLAAERREALERLDGTRNPLRTHLPR